MTVPLNVWKPIDGKAYRKSVFHVSHFEEFREQNSQFNLPIWQPLDHKSLLICSDPLELQETEESFIRNCRRMKPARIIKSHDEVVSESDKVLSGKDFKLGEVF